MILLVDAGNSMIRLASLDAGGAPVLLCREPYRRASPVAGLEGSLATLGRPDAIHGASVAGNGFPVAFSAWCEQKGWPLPAWADVPRAAHGLTVGYRSPERLGVDRYAGMLGALHHHGAPFILADCGTALTIDAVDAGGRHLGGVIDPGLQGMRDALCRSTGIGAIPEGRVTLCADNTAYAVASGILRVLAAGIDRIAGEMSSGMEQGCRWLLTGGDAETLSPRLSGRWQIDPLLVMRGLAVLAGAR